MDVNNDGLDPAQGKTQDKAGKEFQAITTQDELDKIVRTRLSREREKYADYDALKQKAGEFDKLQDAQKTEIEKLTERATKAETKAAAFEKAEQAAKWRSEVRKENGLPESVDPLLTGDTLEEIKAKAEILAAQLSKSTKPVVKTDTGTHKGPEADEKFAALGKLREGLFGGK